MIDRIIDRSILGDNGARVFARNVGSGLSFAEMRNAIEAALVSPKGPTSHDYATNVIAKPFVDTVDFFRNERLTRAFPGVRGVKEFTSPQDVVARLDHLLQSPLGFRSNLVDSDIVGTQHPIWWWRGYTNFHVDSYRRLSETDILLTGDELRIHRAIVHNPYANEEQSFVYLEFKPMPPTGLNSYEEGALDELQEELGCVSEEYALFRGGMISRAEYDDGGTFLDGRLVETTGEAELRRRVIMPYNLIIAPQQSPINNVQFDRALDSLMNGMLKGTHTIDNVIAAVGKLPSKTRMRY